MIQFESVMTHLRDVAESLAAQSEAAPQVCVCTIDVSDI
jgi:hypothetical protein